MIFTSESKILNVINFLKENYGIATNIINQKNTEYSLKNSLKKTETLRIDDSTKIISIKDFFSTKYNLNMEFYISETGKLPLHISLSEVGLFAEKTKYKKSLIGKIELAKQMILNQKSYNDIDWCFRFLEKIILEIKTDKEIEALKSLLESVEKFDKEIYQKTVNLIRGYSENNLNLIKIFE